MFLVAIWGLARIYNSSSGESDTLFWSLPYQVHNVLNILKTYNILYYTIYIIYKYVM